MYKINANRQGEEPDYPDFVYLDDQRITMKTRFLSSADNDVIHNYIVNNWFMLMKQTPLKVKNWSWCLNENEQKLYLIHINNIQIIFGTDWREQYPHGNWNLYPII